MTTGSPVYLTGNTGNPVTLEGAANGSIPAAAIANPAGAGNDAPIITGSGGNLIAAAGYNSSVLFQSHIPFIVAPSGTMGNNGAMSAVNTLPFTYASSYVYLPANAISAGSVAGWYYATWSSATAGTVFNNIYTTGLPTIPASPTAFATTGPGAWTGSTSGQNAQTYSMPGNTMGLRDTIRTTVFFSTSNTANNKVAELTLGGSQIGGSSGGLANVLSVVLQTETSNRDITNSQVSSVSGGTTIGAVSQALLMTTIDTTTAQSVVAVAGKVTATEYCVCESFIVELLQGS